MNMVLGEQVERDTCKGHHYSYRHNVYIGGRGELVDKHVFTPLKRISCPGCPVCGGLMDMLADEVDAGGVPFPVGLNESDTVTLVAVNDGRGFEDLYDEYHLEFVKSVRDEEEETVSHVIIREIQKVHGLTVVGNVVYECLSEGFHVDQDGWSVDTEAWDLGLVKPIGAAIRWMRWLEFEELDYGKKNETE